MIPRSEPGWIGAFSREQAAGALPNGTRVVKHNSEPRDGTPDGTPGVVLGSGCATFPEAGGETVFFYWIEWAHRPRVAVGVMATKLRKANA